MVFTLGEKRLQACLSVLARFCYMPPFSEPRSHYELNFFVWLSHLKTASNGFHFWVKTFAGLSEGFGAILLQAVIWWALYGQGQSPRCKFFCIGERVQTFFPLKKSRTKAFVNGFARFCYRPFICMALYGPGQSPRCRFFCAGALGTRANGFSLEKSRTKAFVNNLARFCYRPFIWWALFGRDQSPRCRVFLCRRIGNACKRFSPWGKGEQTPLWTVWHDFARGPLFGVPCIQGHTMLAKWKASSKIMPNRSQRPLFDFFPGGKPF